MGYQTITGQFLPPSGSKKAKPSSDYIPLGGFVFRPFALEASLISESTSMAKNATMRARKDRLIRAAYLAAVLAAMFGWLWLIAWIALQLI